MKAGMRKPDEDRKDVQTSVRMTRGQHDRISACARKSGMSVSNFVVNVAASYADMKPEDDGADLVAQPADFQSALRHDMTELREAVRLNGSLLRKVLDFSSPQGEGRAGNPGSGGGAA